MQDRHPEHQYLDLLRHAWERGSERIDRTGVGTRALAGTMMKFDLSDGTVPVFTTKKVLWDVALKELLWFLAGETNIQPLVRQGVHIWTEWPLKRYREETGHDISKADFEARIAADDGFASLWGDNGPIYGRQWRRWRTHDGREIDQVAETVRLLREDPYSRRNLFHAWNVSDLKEMSLTPCHMVYQWIVTDGRLNLVMFQRSADCVLGVPFNVISCAILLRMLAQQADMEPGTLTWMGGDTHVYLNHAHVIEEQTRREPRPFPKLVIKRRPPSIDDYAVGDFELVGYDPHGFIRAPVAV